MSSVNLLYLEASLVDYKESLETKKPRSWLKSISAFANTFGGRLVFGVKNEPRAVVGLSDPQQTISKLSELIKARIDPAPYYRAYETTLEGKACVVIEIQNGPAYPYYYVSDGTRVAYVRHGDQSIEASARELNELILKGLNQTFDALPSSYRIEDVSFTLLAATFKQQTRDDFVLPRDLLSTQLANENGQVTNGGLLLCDQGILKQSRVFCTRWKGNCKGNVNEDALDDKEFGNASLITLLQNAEDFVRIHMKNPWSIKGMVREERSDYPYNAVREVLVNALIHRDYQILGSEIHIDIFDDRMEIYSPGGMINGKRIQDMNIRHIPSMRRNQIISDVFARLHLMDRRGSGIDRILNAYMAADGKPEFYSDSDFFLVILPNRGIDASTTLIPADSHKNVATSGKESATSVKESATPVKESATSATDRQDVERETFRQELEKLPLASKTRQRLEALFHRYGYTYPFHSSNVSDVFGIKQSAATQILRKLRKVGLIESPEYGLYKFKRNERHL